MEAIPITLSEITKEWVAAQLNTKNLTGIRLEPMGEGVGMMSVMAVVHLEWGNKTEGPNSIVIKLAASNETNRNVAKQFNLYLKEVSYYKEMLEAYLEGEKAGLGAVNFQGKMVDIAMVRHAENIINRSKAIESRA